MNIQIYKKRNYKELLFELLRRILRVFFVFIDRNFNTAIRKYFLFAAPKNIRKIIWNYHKLDLKHLDELTLSENEMLFKLKNNGVVKFHKNFSEEVDLFLNTNNPVIQDTNYVNNFDFDNELFIDSFVNSGVKELIDCYYASNAFYREKPAFRYASKKGLMQKPPPSYIFHADGYRQVTAMMLLNDLEENSIHMEYAIGSNKTQQHTYDRRRLNQAGIVKKYDIFQLIGKKGDIFIFDTEGFHRVNYFNEVSSDSFRMLFTQNFHIGTYGRKYSIDS